MSEDAPPPQRSNSKLQRVPRSRMYRLHLVVVGASSCGKSCLLKKFCEDRFVGRYISTIGVDFGVKVVPLGDFELRIQIWDLAGGSEFLDVRNEFYKEVHAALFVYDTSQRDSFMALSSIMDETRRYGANFGAMALAGTKCDLAPPRVGEHEARAWATKNDMSFLQVSAQSGQNVRTLFMHLFARAIAARDDAPPGMARAALVAAKTAAAVDGINLDL